MVKITKWKLYEKLHNEFQDLIPEYAKDCDVNVSEAHYDKFGKDYIAFHEKENELVEYKELEARDED